MKITMTEDLRPGNEFRLLVKSVNKAPACFITVINGDLCVTRRLADLLFLDDDHPIVANWHGERRTDAFACTAGGLRDLAAKFEAAEKLLRAPRSTGR